MVSDPAGYFVIFIDRVRRLLLAQAILRDEVSDEAVEAAASVALGGFPALPHTYCFACPASRPQVGHSLA